MPHRGHVGQAKPSAFRRIGQVLDYTSLGMNFVGSALAASGMGPAAALGGGLVAGGKALGLASTGLDLATGADPLTAVGNLAMGALTSRGVADVGGSVGRALSRPSVIDVGNMVRPR